MRFDLTPASHRVLERAAGLRLQRGIAAISSAKVLWALFEEDECRAAQWLQEAGLTLEHFGLAFAIQIQQSQILQSPISAPSFPAGSYGISPGQYTPPPSPEQSIDPSHAGNNPPNVGNPFPKPLPPDGSEHEHHDDPAEPPQDAWEPTEMPKYSLYSKMQSERKSPNQSRLQFYLDDQWINIGLLTPELEDNLETVAHRFVRQDRKQPISVAGGIKQIAVGVLTFSLTTEHLLLAAVLDNGEVGRYLQENGFDATELYQRIETADGRRQTAEGDGRLQTADGSRGESAFGEFETPLASAAVCRLSSAVSFYRLLDAAANRGREAIRVLEDYVRFLLDDADLTQQLKNFRHQFQNVLQRFPMKSRLEARNTEYDVGTDISAEGEYERPTVEDILSANFSRLQETLRSLEEFSKMFDSQTARQFEQLRYACYTLHREVGKRQTADDSNEPATVLPEEER